MMNAVVIVNRLLESYDPSGLAYWHGARVGRAPGAPGPDGLIFASTDRDYASTFTDPMEKHSPEERAAHLVQARVSIRHPKVFDMQNDAEFEAFTQRGISAESLRAEGFDGAILVNGTEIVDVAVIDRSQFSVLNNDVPQK